MLRLGSLLLCANFGVGVLAATTGILLAAPAPFPSRKPVTGDLKKMQGRWVQVGWEAWRLHPGCWGGSTLLHHKGTEQKERWIIAGDRLTRQTGTFWAIRLNPRKHPAEVDLERIWPQPALRQRGLYKLEGDTLSASLSDFGGKRPASLGGRAGDHVLIFKRQRDRTHFPSR
jgi:uncharacterized protein (TIGR03067 family)